MAQIRGSQISGSVVSASYALTASHALNFDTGLFITTSSFNVFTSSYNTGSFTGSFVGDGSGLINLPIQIIETGSFAITGSNAFIGDQSISGSLNVTGSITAPTFIGDGSQLIGITAASKWSGSNPITRNSDVEVTGSLRIISNNTSISDLFLIRSGSEDYIKVSSTGAVSIQNNANDVFLIKNQLGNSILNVSQSGVVIVATQSLELMGPAPIGGIYFTSSSLFIGIED